MQQHFFGPRSHDGKHSKDINREQKKIIALLNERKYAADRPALLGVMDEIADAVNSAKLHGVPLVSVKKTVVKLRQKAFRMVGKK